MIKYLGNRCLGLLLILIDISLVEDRCRLLFLVAYLYRDFLVANRFYDIIESRSRIFIIYLARGIKIYADY